MPKHKVWLIVIDDRHFDPEYRICDSLEAAKKLFEEIVRANYYNDSYKDEEKLLQEQIAPDCTSGEWEWSVGDFISYGPYEVLTMEDIKSVIYD